MKWSQSPVRQSGLTLIEVLIAVLVLAVGLLALAALQSSLARNAAEARARSQAVSFAEMLVEQQRSVGFAGIVAIGDVATGGDPAAVDALAALRATLGDSVAASVDVATFREPLDPTVPAISEHKTVTANVSWTGADGEARQISMSSVVSPVSLSFNPVPVEFGGDENVRAVPTVRTRSPAGPGVIPIAIGGDSETAATNPRPEIMGRGGNTSVVGTRYDVLTFRNLESDLVQVQQRVETQVIACQCQFGAPIANSVDQVAQWPAFWNGLRYAVYQPEEPAEPAGAAAGAGPAPAGQGRNAIVQSTWCLECCRDHHDKASAEPLMDENVRFSRLPEHLHYNVLDGVFTPAGSGDIYQEACRLVRVDGFWRVATDLNLEHTGLLETAAVGGVRAKSAVPSEATADSYADFVLEFLKGFYPGMTPADVDALYTDAGLDPVALNVSKPPPVDLRWLHGRGLYVDFIEKQARDYIALTCEGRPLSSGCYLPHVPFTGINITELAFWRALQGTDFDGTRSDALFISSQSSPVFGDPLSPNSGNVYATPSTVQGSVYAGMGIGPSNAGVAAYGPGIRPEDEDWEIENQEFVLGDGSQTEGMQFQVEIVPGPNTTMPHLTDTSAANNPVVNWSDDGSIWLGCAETSNYGPGQKDLDPNPYRCQTYLAAGSAVRAQFSNYNRETTVRQRATCTTPEGVVIGKNNVDVRMCVNYGVSAITPAATLTVSADGSMSESTVATFDTMPAGGQVRATFVRESETMAPVLVCRAGNNENQNEITFAACP